MPCRTDAAAAAPRRADDPTFVNGDHPNDHGVFMTRASLERLRTAALLVAGSLCVQVDTAWLDSQPNGTTGGGDFWRFNSLPWHAA